MPQRLKALARLISAASSPRAAWRSSPAVTPSQRQTIVSSATPAASSVGNGNAASSATRKPAICRQRALERRRHATCRRRGRDPRAARAPRARRRARPHRRRRCRAVAGQVDAAHRRAAGGVALRQELQLHGIERERNLRQIGELRLRAQAVAEGDGVAGEPAFRARRVAIDEATRRRRPSPRPRSAGCRSPRRCRGRAAPRRTTGPWRTSRRRAAGRAAARRFAANGVGVEHGGDLDARLRVLVGDEIEQRSGAHEDDARADGATLVLQGDLRAAQRVDAGQRPARKGDDPVARAGRQDDVAIGNLLGSARRTRQCSAPCRRSQTSVSGR